VTALILHIIDDMHYEKFDYTQFSPLLARELAVICKLEQNQYASLPSSSIPERITTTLLSCFPQLELQLDYSRDVADAPFLPYQVNCGRAALGLSILGEVVNEEHTRRTGSEFFDSIRNVCQIHGLQKSSSSKEREHQETGHLEHILL
jgi:hypothetical protein